MSAQADKKRMRAEKLRANAEKQIMQAEALEKQVEAANNAKIMAKIREINCPPASFAKVLESIKTQLASGKLEITIPANMFETEDD